MAKIFISIPVLGKPELKMMSSLYQAIHTCKDHQIRLYYNENDSLISRVRNAHISVFMNEFKECDYFMSLDSDLEIINCYASNNIFTKLISHNVDFVGGLYALKKEGKPRPSSIPEDGNMNVKFDSGLKEMKWLSSGCWCIKRSAVQKMIDAYPELAYDGDDNMSGKKLYGLYIPYLKDVEQDGVTFKKYLSEDWAYCDRWKKAGGKIFADTSIALKHIGAYPYTLWNLEVVATKKENAPVTEQPKPTETKPSLPEPGFDLGTI